MLYSLLETQTRDVSLKFFENAHFPIKHLAIILIVNKPLSKVLEKQSTMAAPLVERTSEICFSGYGTDKKRVIAKDVIRKFREKNPKISEPDQRTVDSIVQHDKSPGVRDMLKMLNNYLISLQNALYWNQLTDVQYQDFDIENQMNLLKTSAEGGGEKDI